MISYEFNYFNKFLTKTEPLVRLMEQTAEVRSARLVDGEAPGTTEGSIGPISSSCSGIKRGSWSPWWQHVGLRAEAEQCEGATRWDCRRGLNWQVLLYLRPYD